MKAILLAAGMGTRLRPLTEDTPKSLIKINDEPLLERQVKFLKEIGVDEIYVITGYLAEKFEYLKEKYNINLIYNEYYNKYNNIYSMFLAKDFLGDSYVIDADVYLTRNFLRRDIEKSSYFSGIKDTLEKEWKINYNDQNKISNIEVVSGKNYILSGISYWSNKDANIIKNILNSFTEKFESKELKNLYWDDVVKENLDKLDVYIEKISSNDWYEIDNLKELEEVKKIFKK
ncbi:NTP transferase domain-containing protein [Cetobacterium sp. 8H]|uniref:sugar phosphate nucleotidyltransferase n=1 Tax=Cetobacterium sp. 8H TaxID=2759681 RepID=UPI00163CE4E9|nr:sugar phosphate nucleotidyltransferase [Cetobacterium sp. 8H]MBC2850930.1 NTP transferase domain-containing protein [Cetobacterium sp. 8H]